MAFIENNPCKGGFSQSEFSSVQTDLRVRSEIYNIRSVRNVPGGGTSDKHSNRVAARLEFSGPTGDESRRTYNECS
jgi:hypothetical protein